MDEYLDWPVTLVRDRIKAYGYHLDIPAGTSTRFEPGVTKTVNLTQISGLKTIKGGSSIATSIQ
jgi:urease